MVLFVMLQVSSWQIDLFKETRQIISTYHFTKQKCLSIGVIQVNDYKGEQLFSKWKKDVESLQNFMAIIRTDSINKQQVGIVWLLL